MSVKSNLAVLPGLACACVLGIVGPASGINIAWVTFHPGPTTPSAAAATIGFTEAPDKGYTDLLATAGHNVTRYLTTDTPDLNFLNTFDLVIVGRSVDSGNYELDPETRAWNTGVYKPMMVMGGYAIRNVRLGYTTGGNIPDTSGAITLQATADGLATSLFTGIPLDGTNTMVSNYTTGLVALPFQQNGVNTVQRGISVNTDTLVPNGKVLATVATPGDAALNGMIIGKLDPFTAMSTTPVDYLGGHRVVFLSGSREHADPGGAMPAPSSAQIAGLMDLTPVGQQLFLNAVSYTASLGSILPGDIDLNGVVNGLDYAIIRDHFNMTNATHADGDVNLDGLVNFADFRIWKNNRTAPGSGAGFEDFDLPGAVPEPGSLVLLVMGMVSLCVTTGRRR